MKKLIFIFLLLFVSSNVWAAEEFSFRGVKFGMSMEEVRTHATGKLYEESNRYLFYEIEDMYGLRSSVGYWFSPASYKLYKIDLGLFVPSDMDQTIKYAEIKEDLWAKYKGDEEPLKDDYGWRFVNNVTFVPGLKVLTYLEFDHEDELVIIIIEFYEEI